MFDTISEPAGVEEWLTLAVVNRRPWLAVRVDAPLEAGFDSCNPADSDLIQPFLDVRVCRAQALYFADELLKGRCVDFKCDGLTSGCDHDRMSLTLWNPDLRDS